MGTPILSPRSQFPYCSLWFTYQIPAEDIKEKINCSLLFKVLKLRSTPGMILELIFTNLVNITQAISGKKKNYVSPTLKWQEKTKQGSKSQWPSRCKESLSSLYLYHQREDSRKKHSPEPGLGKRRKVDFLSSSILSGNGQTNPHRDISWWRCHLESSYRCVSHTEKELTKKTVSLGVILWKTGNIYKYKATWTPKKWACLLEGHNCAIQQQEE